MKINIADLEESVLEVIGDIVPKHLEFRDPDGTAYTLRITPYRTIESRIEGVVLVLLGGICNQPVRGRSSPPPGSTHTIPSPKAARNRLKSV